MVTLEGVKPAFLRMVGHPWVTWLYDRMLANKLADDIENGASKCVRYCVMGGLRVVASGKVSLSLELDELALLALSLKVRKHEGSGSEG